MLQHCKRVVPALDLRGVDRRGKMRSSAFAGEIADRLQHDQHRGFGVALGVPGLGRRAAQGAVRGGHGRSIGSV